MNTKQNECKTAAVRFPLHYRTSYIKFSIVLDNGLYRHVATQILLPNNFNTKNDNKTLQCGSIIRYLTSVFNKTSDRDIHRGAGRTRLLAANTLSIPDVPQLLSSSRRFGFSVREAHSYTNVTA